MMETNAPSTMPEWVPDAIFYQIFPDRFFNGDPSNDPPNAEPWGNPPTPFNFFGGDLRGIIRKLDYLEDLGVNALYLNPIFKARTNHKYDTCDYYEVDTAFGGNSSLKELVEELHRRGMRIILDGVFNHCGDGFWAFEDIKTLGASSIYSDWFLVRSYPIRANPPSYYTCGGCWYLPKLNVSNPQVREYILKVATHWLEEAGIDGWRLDTPCKIPLDFWREFRTAVKVVDPQAYLVGEIWRDAGIWIKGNTFDGITNYRLRELILDYCANGILDAEDFAYEVASLHESHGSAAPFMLNLMGCHDTPRVLTVFRGEVERLLIALTFQFTTVGAPMIHYGDEIGMVGNTDPDCRRTMIWEEAKWNRQIFNLYLELIALRRSHKALRQGNFESLLTFDKVYAYRRVYRNDEIIVVLNPGQAVMDLGIPTNSQVEKWRDLIRGNKHNTENKLLLFECVPATSYTVLLPDSD
jgi:cyclomaltodextrinase